MARFLFVVVPLVARVLAAAAIGEALTEAGHDVAWCGPENDLRPLIAPGAVFYPTGKRSYRQQTEMGAAAVRELWDQYVMPLNRFISRPADHAIAEYQPDVVVADQYALAGALAAEKRRVRWATLAAGVLELTPPIDDPALREWVRSKSAQVLRAAGLPADESVDLLFSPYLVIATTTRALVGTVPMPENWMLVGAALGTRRGEPSFRWDWWDPGRRHVLVTGGTVSAHLMRDFLARMMAALEPMANCVQVVFNSLTGWLAESPPNVLVAPRVPMLELMPHLDAVICQAGQSTVNEALAHGVPLVVAPVRLGELATAEHVTRTGVGIAVSFSQATTEQLAAAVTAVLDDPRYRANARWMAEEFSAAGGAGAAAAHLVALAGRG